MPNALLVYPKHPPTYWGNNYALDLLGIKAAFPPLGLLTLAAMFPSRYNLRLVDLNVTPSKTPIWSGRIWHSHRP